MIHTFKDVICCVANSDKFKAISEVVTTCSIFSDLSDRDTFLLEVIKREKIETTGIGRGVAIAHGKLKTIPRVKVGLGLSQKGIDFGAADGHPVHLLFVIGSSPFRQIEYLRALAAIMRFVKMTDIRDELIKHTSLDFSDEQNNSCLTFLDMMTTQQFAEFMNVNIV